MKEFLESIKNQYIANEITAEQGLESIAKKLGFKISFCDCMRKELEFRDDGLYCPNCNKLVSTAKEL